MCEWQTRRSWNKAVWEEMLHVLCSPEHGLPSSALADFLPVLAAAQEHQADCSLEHLCNLAEQVKATDPAYTWEVLHRLAACKEVVDPCAAKQQMAIPPTAVSSVERITRCLMEFGSQDLVKFHYALSVWLQVHCDLLRLQFRQGLPFGPQLLNEDTFLKAETTIQSVELSNPQDITVRNWNWMRYTP